MLTLVIAVTLSQCSTDFECKGERICVSGRCVDSDAPRAVPRSVVVRPPSPEVEARRETLLAQRPGLGAPIASMALGGALAALGMLVGIGVNDAGSFAAGLGVGGALLMGGAVWFFAALWARSQVGDMLEGLQR